MALRLRNGELALATAQVEVKLTGLGTERLDPFSRTSRGVELDGVRVPVVALFEILERTRVCLMSFAKLQIISRTYRKDGSMMRQLLRDVVSLSPCSTAENETTSLSNCLIGSR